MCEDVVQSDHRPVMCEFLLKEENSATQWFREDFGTPLQLRMSDFQLESNSLAITALKICCPIPCEDVLWDRRLVSVGVILDCRNRC